MHLLLSRNVLTFLFLTSIIAAIAATVLVFGGTWPPYAKRFFSADAYGDPQFTFQRINFSDIEDWRSDTHDDALPVFLRSCEKLLIGEDADAANPLEALGTLTGIESFSGTVSDWRPACDEAKSLALFSYADDNAKKSSIRVFFETNFRPFQILDHRNPDAAGPARKRGAKVDKKGVFTGYFDPIYPALGFRTLEFSAPVYKRPDDLVSINLGNFRKDLAGIRIAGTLQGNNLQPYYSHQEINDGALEDTGSVIAWMRPTDLLFLQIQGSGQIRYRNGTIVRLGYDGQNGHPYTAIGRTLINEGEVAREDMSMQAIREWLGNASTQEAKRVRETNASYVFFRELNDLPDPELGPLGAMGTQLTTGRSLAVDRRYHALGTPVWVSINLDDGAPGDSNLRRLFIAQDTGGAIRGPIRGDLFTGAGERAGETAGTLNARGEMVVLLPVSIARRLEQTSE